MKLNRLFFQPQLQVNTLGATCYSFISINLKTEAIFCPFSLKNITSNTSKPQMSKKYFTLVIDESKRIYRLAVDLLVTA